MTAVLFLLAGIALGVIPSVIAVNLRAEAHHWRLVRLEYLRVDRLYNDRDHYAREARRERHRAWLNRQLVGDLTIQLAHARHRQPRRSPVPAYGPHRHKVSA